MGGNYVEAHFEGLSNVLTSHGQSKDNRYIDVVPQLSVELSPVVTTSRERV
jgi:hypothetical protein